MTPIEDRLRAAMTSVATAVHDDAIPPLRLPEDRRHRRLRHSLRRPARWLAPLAAAAALLAVIGGLAAIAAHGPAAPAAAGGLAAAPPYYVSLDSAGVACCPSARLAAPPAVAVVRATATGAIRAVVKPPKPYAAFVAVSGSASDREFVLAAQRPARFPMYLSSFPATRFYLLRIDPGARDASKRAVLTGLPVPILGKGFVFNGIALSPDASKLAVSSTNWTPTAPRGVAFEPRIRVYSLTTGAVWTWSGGTDGYGYAPDTYQQFWSWTGDSRILAFFGRVTAGASGIVLLNTAAKASSGADATIAVRSSDFGYPEWRSIRISPDGKTIVAAIEVARTGEKTIYQQLVAYSARTGTISRVISNAPLGRLGYALLDWASPSGHILIVSGTNDTGAGVYDGNHYTPIPWSRKILMAAW